MAGLPLGKKKPEEKEKSAAKQPQTAPAEEAAHPPQVDGFKIKGSLKKGKLKDLASILRSISFLEIAPEKDVLNVLYVESRDIDKNPYLFSVLKIKDDEIEVMYTIPSGISPRKRRMDVIRYMFNILSLIAKSYEVENKTLYQLVENSIKDLSASVTMDYTKLYTEYDTMKKEISDYKRKLNRLNEQVQALTTQNYDLKSQNDEMRLRVKELESLSDDALKAKLQEWIKEHNGAVNVVEFGRVYKASEARVEEILNKLVSEGYIEVVQ